MRTTHDGAISLWIVLDEGKVHLTGTVLTKQLMDCVPNSIYEVPFVDSLPTHDLEGEITSSHTPDQAFPLFITRIPGAT